MARLKNKNTHPHPLPSRGSSRKASAPLLRCRMIIPTRYTALSMAAALALTACEGPNLNSDPTPDRALDPQDEFWSALSTHCGKAYAGELVSEDAADADFVGRDMVMHVRECSDTRIAVPFHVEGEDGTWDRSRTWLITRNDAGGLRLKHDHRHEDGESDAVTMYGGDTEPGEEGAGSAREQDFPVDAESIALFEREGLTASVTNVWTVAVDPVGTDNGVFAYQLKRTVDGGAPEDRHFRVEFALNQEVEAPPAAWGQE